MTISYRVDRTPIADDIVVSTIELPDLLGHGPRWETLVLAERYDAIDQDGQGYRTREAAVEGHQAWVEQTTAWVAEQIGGSP